MYTSCDYSNDENLMIKFERREFSKSIEIVFSSNRNAEKLLNITLNKEQLEKLLAFSIPEKNKKIEVTV